VALIIFIAASIVCIFASNIIVLIVFRAVEGGSVAALLVVSQGIVSDIYPAQMRGEANGIFFVPFLLGPVIGPLIGGVISGTVGWRSTFILLSAFSFIVLVIVFFVVPETHQYFVKERFHKANPNKRIIDAVPNDKPIFKHFWKPLVLLADLTILPYILMATATFAAMFICFVIFPLVLDKSPYNDSEIIIGVLFIPSGLAMFIGSLLGGRLSDRVSQYFGGQRCPEGRLVPAVAFSILIPIALIIFGWTIQYKINVAGPIMGLVLLSFSRSIIQPCIFAYLTVKKQSEAAGASAVNTVLNFIAAGIGVTITAPLKDAIGVGPFLSAICGINTITIVVAIILVYKKIRQATRVMLQENDIALQSTKPNVQ
jgi:MFS family permease